MPNRGGTFISEQRVTFAAGESSVDLVLTPVADSEVESEEDDGVEQTLMDLEKRLRQEMKRLHYLGIARHRRGARD